MSSHARIDRGVPAGGQFARQQRAEAITNLTTFKPFSADMVHTLANLNQPDECIDLSPGQVDETNARIAETGDFSANNVRSIAEELYLQEHGYSRSEYARYLETYGDNSAAFGDPSAIRRDIVQMRKDHLNAA